MIIIIDKSDKRYQNDGQVRWDTNYSGLMTHHVGQANLRSNEGLSLESKIIMGRNSTMVNFPYHATLKRGEYDSFHRDQY